MRRSAVTLALLITSLLCSGAAHASPFKLGHPLRLMTGSPTLPPEWAGVWTTQDSMFDCPDTPTGTDIGSDSLCTGQGYMQGGTTFITCTGTADATTIHLTCTGTLEVFPNCLATFDIQLDVVRTGTTYRADETINTSYSGTGEGCSFFPPTCTRVVTYGTRTGPVPAEYCAQLPVRKSTWGQLKLLYR